MSKYNYNAMAEDGGIFNVGTGTIYLTELDENDKPIGNAMSLGFNTAISITSEKETKELSHTLHEIRKVVETIVLSESVTAEVEMQNYNPKVVSKLTGSNMVKVTGAEETLQVTVTEEDLEDGFNIILGQAAGTVTIKGAGEVVYEEGKNYILNNGNIFVLSSERQLSLDAVELIEDGELTVTNTGIDTTVMEFGKGGDKNYQMYIEMYNSFDKSGLYRYTLHKVKPIVDTLPVKADSNDEMSYTVAFTATESKHITDPTKSKTLKIEYVKLKD